MQKAALQWLQQLAEILQGIGPTDPTVTGELYTDISMYNLHRQLLSLKFIVITVNDRGQEINRQHRSAEFFAEDLGNGVFMEMVSIPGGTFTMGSPNSEKRREIDESPHHRVTVPGFFMARYQVTQRQWQAVMGDNPSRFKGENLPVEMVSWHDSQEFCKRLAKKNGLLYRLPSEAEWEYACRAGTTTPFHFGATITTDLANYDSSYSYAQEPKGKSCKRTTPVGSFPPNAFGLYDMHGNVWEWCQDTWHDNYQGAPTDGRAWITNNSKKERKVLRGGFWSRIPRGCRSAARNFSSPDNRSYIRGLRVVCSGVKTL